MTSFEGAGLSFILATREPDVNVNDINQAGEKTEKANGNGEASSAGAGPSSAGAGPTSAGAGPSSAGAGPSSAGAGPSSAGAGPSTAAGATDPVENPTNGDLLEFQNATLRFHGIHDEVTHERVRKWMTQDGLPEKITSVKDIFAFVIIYKRDFKEIVTSYFDKQKEKIGNDYDKCYARTIDIMDHIVAVFDIYGDHGARLKQLAKDFGDGRANFFGDALSDAQDFMDNTENSFLEDLFESDFAAFWNGASKDFKDWETYNDTSPENPWEQFRAFSRDMVSELVKLQEKVVYHRKTCSEAMEKERDVASEGFVQEVREEINRLHFDLAKSDPDWMRGDVPTPNSNPKWLALVRKTLADSQRLAERMYGPERAAGPEKVLKEEPNSEIERLVRRFGHEQSILIHLEALKVDDRWGDIESKSVGTYNLANALGGMSLEKALKQAGAKVEGKDGKGTADDKKGPAADKKRNSQARGLMINTI